MFDTFCGCTTNSVATGRLCRKWVVCDVSVKGTELVVQRIRQNQPKLVHKIHQRIDLPKLSGLGKLPYYEVHKHRFFGYQHGCCYGCQDNFEPRHLEVDQIILKNAGGSHHNDNLQILCSHCNKAKGQQGQEYLSAHLQLNQKLL